MVAWRLPRRFGRRRSRCGRAWRQPIRSAEAMPPLTGPRCLRFERRPLHRKSRRVLMTTPLSQDLRDGLRGASMRVAPRGAARRFEVSPSAAIKLMRRVRETGSTAPAKIGGHRRAILQGHEDYRRDLAGAHKGIDVGMPSCPAPPGEPNGPVVSSPTRVGFTSARARRGATSRTGHAARPDRPADRAARTSGSPAGNGVHSAAPRNPRLRSRPNRTA